MRLFLNDWGHKNIPILVKKRIIKTQSDLIIYNSMGVKLATTRNELLFYQPKAFNYNISKHLLIYFQIDRSGLLANDENISECC